MDEIAWFWLAAAAVSSVVGAGMAVQSGRQQARSMKDQALAAEMEARVAELDVKQTAARRTEQLVGDLGAIRARRAAMNVGGSSASAIAAEKGYEKEYMRTLRSDILGKRYGVVSRLTQANGLRIGAKGALMSGYASGVANLTNAFGNLASIPGPKKAA